MPFKKILSHFNHWKEESKKINGQTLLKSSKLTLKVWNFKRNLTFSSLSFLVDLETINCHPNVLNGQKTKLLTRKTWSASHKNILHSSSQSVIHGFTEDYQKVRKKVTLLWILVGIVHHLKVKKFGNSAILYPKRMMKNCQEKVWLNLRLHKTLPYMGF